MDQDLYMCLVDEIFNEMEMKRPKTADEAFEIMYNIKHDRLRTLEDTLDEIFDDYIEQKGLEWLDE